MWCYFPCSDITVAVKTYWIRGTATLEGLGDACKLLCGCFYFNHIIPLSFYVCVRVRAPACVCMHECVCVCACHSGNCLSSPLSPCSYGKGVVYKQMLYAGAGPSFRLPHEPAATSQPACWNVKWSGNTRTRTLASFLAVHTFLWGSTHVSTHCGTSASSWLAAVLNKTHVSVRRSRPMDLQFLLGCVSVQIRCLNCSIWQQLGTAEDMCSFLCW